MTKHTKFSEYYQKIDRKERASSLQGFLVHFDVIVETVLHGDPQGHPLAGDLITVRKDA